MKHFKLLNHFRNNFVKKTLDIKIEIWYNYITPPTRPKERKLAAANEND